MSSELRIDVVKHGGERPTEEFNPDKLHRSIVAACLALRTPEGQCEEIARTVTTGVIRWCDNRPEVTSADIRRIGAELLNKHHPEAAYLFKQQLTVL